jgi:hypothetical protein
VGQVCAKAEGESTQPRMLNIKQKRENNFEVMVVFFKKVTESTSL